MSIKKIFICGNFGYNGNKLDGQTVKTRVLKDELEETWEKENINFVDTSFIKINPVRVIIQIIRHFISATNIIMMPDQRAFKFLLPVFIFINMFKKKDIRYVVIGGWLPSFLANKKYYLRLSKKLQGIYVETNAMKRDMENLNLSNVHLLPNFRRFDFKPSFSVGVDLPIKLVSFSRVLREKGIEISIKAVNSINAKNKKNIVSLDIYGPVQSGYEDTFEEIMKNQNSQISYKGILQPDEIYSTLSRYDLLVFPTFYSAEGFPGTIIDAYISGVPVIASDWAYNTEFVEEGYSGKICEARNVEDLIAKIEFFINNLEKIAEYKQNCVNEAEKYHADNVVATLINHMKSDI